MGPCHLQCLGPHHPHDLGTCNATGRCAAPLGANRLGCTHSTGALPAANVLFAFSFCGFASCASLARRFGTNAPSDSFCCFCLRSLADTCGLRRSLASAKLLTESLDCAPSAISECLREPVEERLATGSGPCAGGGWAAALGNGFATGFRSSRAALGSGAWERLGSGAWEWLR